MVRNDKGEKVDIPGTGPAKQREPGERDPDRERERDPNVPSPTVPEPEPEDPYTHPGAYPSE